MAANLLPITSETIPTGSCPETYNDLAQLFASHFFAVQNTGVGKQWIFSAAKPTLEQAPDYGWFQLNTDGTPIRPYIFAQGLWLALHPMSPGQTIWVFNAVADILSYDGGDGTAIVSPTTGPMWQYARTGNFNNIDDGTIIAAKFPLVQGTLPSGLVLNVADEGGEEQHSQTVAEMAPHTHVIKTVEPIEDKWSGNVTGGGKITTSDQPLNNDTLKEAIRNNNPFFEALSAGGTGTPPVVTPITNLPPYVVGILIQRTQKLYYTITA